MHIHIHCQKKLKMICGWVYNLAKIYLVMNSMKPSLLFLTNAKNLRPEEDVFLADFLSHDFDVTIAHPRDAETFEDTADIILSRNIWPAENELPMHAAFAQRVVRKGLTMCNPLTGRGDQQGKRYLTELFAAGWPVIPSVLRLDDIVRLGETDSFIIKPLRGGSAVGVRKLPRWRLRWTNLADQLVQQFVQIERELSFYFLDGALQYVLASGGPQQRWNLTQVDAPAHVREIAERFAAWNTLAFGIQRIDIAELADGHFLLMEIEDLCPKLSFAVLDEKTRAEFLGKFVASLQRVIVDNFSY